MNADFLAVLEFWEREKGISREVLVQAVEEALTLGRQKGGRPGPRICVASLTPRTATSRPSPSWWSRKRSLPSTTRFRFLTPAASRPDAQLGEELEVEVTPAGFGRIASQYAKQALMQHIRRAEKQLIFTEFKDRVGDIMSGVVRRFERSDVTIDLGKYEALLPNRERVPTEEYQIGERIRCYVKAVESGPHGPEIILSRADPQFVIKLFQLEVSEINDGTIEIKGIAREPGFRTKLAVHTRDSEGGPGGRLRRPARAAGQEYRSRIEQREGGHHQVGREHQDLRRQRAGAGAAQGVQRGRSAAPGENHGGGGPAFAGHRQTRAKRPADLQIDWLAD